MDLPVGELTLPPVIETRRLVMRPLGLDDAQDLMQQLGDWEVARWLAPVPHPVTDEDAWRFIVTLSDAAGYWAVVEKQAFRGAVEVMDGELGFWIGRPSWGRGLATEAACAACGAWFAAGGGELRSSCMEGNHASRRVLLKLGFEDTGPRTIRSASLCRDVPGRMMRLARAPL